MVAENIYLNECFQMGSQGAEAGLPVRENSGSELNSHPVPRLQASPLFDRRGTKRAAAAFPHPVCRKRLQHLARETMDKESLR